MYYIYIYIQTYRVYTKEKKRKKKKTLLFKGHGLTICSLRIWDFDADEGEREGVSGPGLIPSSPAEIPPAPEGLHDT